MARHGLQAVKNNVERRLMRDLNGTQGSGNSLILLGVSM
jgi:hypothetical protein